MPKQLEIIVQARDQASGVFKEVGASAGGLSDKLGSLNSIAESGRGLHHMLREAKHVLLFYELAKVSVESLGGIFESVSARMAGDFDKVATSNRKIFDGLKEIPVIGRGLASATEFLESSFSHLTGKQSTADMEKDIAKKKKALEDYAKGILKLGELLKKSDNEAALAGLTPTDAAIQKAKEKYQQTIDELKPLKKALIEGAGQAKSPQELKEVKRHAAEVQKIIVDAEKSMNAEIAKVRREALEKRQEDEQEQVSKLYEIAEQRHSQLDTLNADLHAKELEADDRNFEAKQVHLKAALDKQIEAIRDSRNKEIEENEKELIKLNFKANLTEIDKTRIETLKQQNAFIKDNADEQERQAKAAAKVEASHERDLTVLDAHKKALQEESAAGNENATLALKHLEINKEQEQLEKALLAILNDEASTEKQKVEAARDLRELKKAQVDTVANELRNTEITLLKQRVALGDDFAAIQLKELENTKEQNDLEAKLNDILHDQKATAQQKAEAERQLKELKQNQQDEKGKEVGDAALFALRQEASLGDKIAENALKKLEVEKQFTAEKQKLIALINGNEATEKQKADARKALKDLDSVEARALQKIGQKGILKHELATAETDYRLAGVAANLSQERDPYQPVVDAQNKNTEVAANILALLAQYFGVQNPKTMLR